MTLFEQVLNPRSIAVVGASANIDKLRGKLLDTVRKCGFPGAIYPVNPSAADIQGLRAYPDLQSLPEVPDLVLIAVPGAQAAAVVAKACALGVKGAVVMSSGVDSAALRAAIGSSAMLLFGANTEGFYHAGNRLAATFAQTVGDHLSAGCADAPRRPGKPVSIVSQSGGMGFALFGRLVKEHLDIHAVITTGNEDGVDCLEVVDHLVAEAGSGVILLFIEGLRDARRFGAVADRAAAAGIPLVVLKVGASHAGRRAAISHTAHLAGSDTAYDAVFRRHGVIRVRDQEALLAVAASFARLPALRGRRAAIVTTSGGAGTWAADQCEAFGIECPELGSSLQAELRAMLPGFASAANPVDATGQAVEDGGVTLVRILARLLDSDEIDAVIVNMGLARPGRIEALNPLLAPLLAAAAKPVLFHSHIHPDETNLAAIADMGGVGVRSLRAAGAALDALARHVEARARVRTFGVAPGRALLNEAQGTLGERETRALLEGYGVSIPLSALTGSADAAMAAARGMGFPVALKIQSPDIAHKTEAGGVALGIAEGALAERYEAILASARAHAPGAKIEGVLVQKMMPPGHEMIVGILDDPDFGALVMIGAGGVDAEILNDTVFSPVPVDRAEALAMIDALKSAAILKGARGRAPADIDALADLLVQVGALAHAEQARLRQFDLNPVIVYPAGSGAVAVDALIVAGPPRPVH